MTVEPLWQLSTPALIGLAGTSILVLLLLIIVVRLHALLALFLVALLTAVAAGVAPDRLAPTLVGGFGNTLGAVGLLVGLGAMLGRLLVISGGAAVLTDALLGRFGAKRAPLALSIASLLFGIPIFFDAGLVVMIPIIFTVARRVGGSLLLYAFPSAVAFSVMHVFVPPHPGPVTAVSLLNADMGLVLALGLLIAIPTWYVTGYALGKYFGRRISLPVPDLLAHKDDRISERPPPLPLVVALLVVPVALIFLNTGLNMAVEAKLVAEGTLVDILRTLGQTPVALLITVLLASATLIRRIPGKLDQVLDGALGPICSLILITGAGGMFGAVLRLSGIGGAVATSLDALGLPLLVAGFVIAAVVRIAQGSATVALTTTAALIAPAVAAESFNSGQLAAVVLALAAGSVFAGHVNDSGFWLVSRFFNMDVKTTLKTWTVGQALIAIVGFLLSASIYLTASVL